MRQTACRLTVHEQPPDAGPIGQVPTHARDRKVVCRRDAADILGLHIEEADRQRIGDFPREPRAREDRDLCAVTADPNAPAEEEIRLSQVHAARRPPVADGERPRVLEEEGSFLRKEQVEPVEVDAFIVDLDLREVGVVRAIEREPRRHAVLDVGAEITERTRIPVWRRVAGDHLADHVGRQLQVAGEADRRRQTGELSRHRDAIEVVLPRQGCPIRRLVAPPDVPLEVHPPRLERPRGVPDGAKRNGELRTPADVRDRRPHLPRPIPVEVEAAAAATGEPAAAAAAAEAAGATLVDDLAVVLLPGWRGAEHEPVLLVGERIEDELEAVTVAK